MHSGRLWQDLWSPRQPDPTYETHAHKSSVAHGSLVSFARHSGLDIGLPLDGVNATHRSLLWIGRLRVSHPPAFAHGRAASIPHQDHQR
jgi:hypothetical protein